MGTATDARHIIRANYRGLLSTLSAKFDGWPFGSVVQYCCDHSGRPWLLLSGLAQHSHNLHEDSRLSLLIWEGDVETLAQGRVSLLAKASPATPSEAFRARFQRLLPESRDYLALPDFRFYALDIHRIRFVAGFGAVHWVAPESYLFPPASALEEGEEGVVGHMNTDHRSALVHYCRHFGGREAREAQMLACDPEGMDILCDGDRMRIDFPEPVQDLAALRHTLVAMARTGADGHAG